MEVLYKVIEESEKVTYIPNRLYYWLSRKDSVTKNKFNFDFENEINISDDIVKFCEEKHPNLNDYAVRRYIRINITLMKKVVANDAGKQKYMQLAKNLWKYKIKNMELGIIMV